ncbi:MAG: hypothetical protein ACE366_14505 [Bradymonadia bacterium]
MYPEFHSALARIGGRLIVVGLAGALVFGCDDNNSTVEAGPSPGQQGEAGSGGAPTGGSAGGGGSAGEGGTAGAAGAGGQPFDPAINPEGTVPVRASSRARVKFKGGKRWARDLAKGLQIPRESVCTELGEYDCVDTVHLIALGGVEPYRLGINDPLPVAPVTAAIAVDRVALAACDVRVTQDLAGGDAHIYVGLSGDDKPSEEVLTAAAEKLYDQLLRRDADPDEVKSLLEFYTEGMSPRDWALGTCFAVASSMEALFY